MLHSNVAFCVKATWMPCRFCFKFLSEGTSYPNFLQQLTNKLKVKTQHCIFAASVALEDVLAVQCACKKLP